MFLAGALYALPEDAPPPESFIGLLDPRFLAHGLAVRGAAARASCSPTSSATTSRRATTAYPASLPYFIPMPFVSPFGTMGAVIGMSGRIRSRAALLDIGAAGPLAGMVVALPGARLGHRAIAGRRRCRTLPTSKRGRASFIGLLKRIILGPIPEGSDMNMHPTAFAGWAGLLVTMLNLIPFGQLDGGHIAYALFGKKQDRFAVWVRRSLLVLLAYNLVVFFGPILLKTSKLSVGGAVGNSLTWLVWYASARLLARLGGREHPPFEPGELSPARRFVAWLCLVLFVLIFMPTPLAQMG